SEAESLRSLIEAQKKRGLRAEMVSRDDLSRMEPSAHGDAVGAALFPDDHRLDNRRLIEGLKALAASRGVEVREHTPVRGVEVEEGRLVAIRIDGGRVTTGALINALGAWATQLDGE